MVASRKGRWSLQWLIGDGALTKDLVRPVLANLLTALLLFFAAVLFKDRIYGLLSRPTVKEYPIYCVAEPYTGTGGELRADFFVINKTGDRMTEADLTDIIKTRAGEEHGQPDPTVRLKWTAKSGQIARIEPDPGFDDDKGTVEVVPARVPGDPWTIHIREIFGKGILRLTIVTNLQRGNITRNSKASLPFSVVYAGD
jgi:hypothetical protein